MSHDQPASEHPSTPSLILALRGWSRGCAALARREFARSLGRTRLTRADGVAFAHACDAAKATMSTVTAVAALVLAARPGSASGDILRTGSGARPGAAATSQQQQAALAESRRRQAESVRRANESLARTAETLRALRIAQEAARAAVTGNPAGVVDGLGAGGLLVANGALPGSAQWDNASAATQSVSGGRTQVEIVQTGAKAVLTWDGFNVGINTDLHINQKAGGADASKWIALNRVTDTTTNPSHILGSIRAEGQVYIINPNGVVFHGSSQVNVHTLVASGLDFRGDTVAERDAAFRQGIAADDNRANYTLGVDTGSGRTMGDVTVDAGARLVADGSGALYLFGKNVTNAGALTTPDGQAMLVAGERVWVTKNTLGRAGATVSQLDDDLRGVRATVQEGGDAVNSGLIEAARGNITLSAKNIVNDGALISSTTAKANGSVTLLAGDATDESAIYWMWPKDFGGVTLGRGSLISIGADESAGTAFAKQFRPGRVDIFGRTITLDEGARIHAPGASATLVAKTHSVTAGITNDTSRIYLASGAEIDLAGLADVAVAMSRNTITANLRLDELKDSPLLRESPLRGAKVSVDLRRGTSVADLSGYYGLTEFGVKELMTPGGSLKLDSGSIVTRAGSRIDLSGGFVRYADGYVETSRLRGADGRLYDITTARKDIAYTGVYDTVRRFESGYAEGRDAGALVIGPRLSLIPSEPEALNLTGEGTRPYFFALEGEMVARTVTGDHQRHRADGTTDPTLAWTRLARPASITVGYELDNKYYGPNVRLGASAPLPADFNAGSAAPAGAPEVVLPARLFDGENFGRLTLVSGIGGGDFTVDPGVILNLGAFGTLSFHGARATINGGILAPGGTVSLLANLAKGWNRTGTSVSPDWATLPEDLRPAVTLGAEARIDVSGAWVNDLRSGLAYGALATDGGSVALRSAYRLSLAPGAAITVNGGGHLTGSNRIVAGDAGDILLQNDLLIEYANGFGGIVPTRPAGDFDIRSAQLSGYALGKGGTLALGTSRAVTLTANETPDSGVTAADRLHLAPDYFRTGGFLHHTVAASGELLVESGAHIAPTARSFLIQQSLWTLDTGADLASALTTVLRPEAFRDSGSLTLAIGLRTGDGSVAAASANPGLLLGLVGSVTVGTGATITMHEGSSVALLALGDLRFDGVIDAPAGTIHLGITDAPDTASLRLGANARLLARGSTRTDIIGGQSVRSVLAGGDVTLDVVKAQGNETHLLADRDARIDVTGVSGTADLLNNTAALLGGPVAYRAVTLPGDAGDVTIAGFRNGRFSSAIAAAPGSPTASGGAIRVVAGDLVNTVRTGLLVAAYDDTRFPRVDLAAPTPATSHTLTIAADSLTSGGADEITLRTASSLNFRGDIALSARRSITLASTPLGVDTDTPAAAVSLSAAYVRFDGYPGLGENSHTPIPGEPAPAAVNTASLRVTGNLIDMTQALDLVGFGDARFVSAGDIRLSVAETSQANVGRLTSAGALTLKSAQTYVTTTASVRTEAADGFLIRSGVSVTFAGNGAAAPAPYAYGETLTVKAPDITQGGVLRAPLGRLRLNATGTLTLTPGSRTSVSAEGRVSLIGAVKGGYVAPFPIKSEDATPANLLAATPVKSMLLAGNTVAVKSGAIVDVSGGGDLAAYEFIPGNGGSRDALTRDGTFAILPGYTSPAAPAVAGGDLAGSQVKVGDAVRLTGVAGLADGVYTLLPAHYALLSGGMAVSVESTGYAAAATSVRLPDGSTLASGRRVVAGTDIADTGYTRFIVTPGAVVRTQSAYNEYRFGAYAAETASRAGLKTPRLPNDAGTLTVRAGASLELSGSGRFTPGSASGRAGDLDIDAAQIALVTPGATAPDGYLRLQADELNAFGVGSLLLGGSRTAAAEGVTLAVRASNILVANDGDSALVLPEVIFAATDKLTFADGATVRAEGAVLTNDDDLLLTGNGALVRASTGARVGLTRTGAGTTSGELSLGAATVLTATGSLALDGTKSVTNRLDARFEAPQLSLSSARVSLGDVPSGADGLVIGGEALATLSRTHDLLLRSYGVIDLYGAATLGARDAANAPILSGLTLDAAAIHGHGASGETATLAARKITLGNRFGATTSESTTGAGALRLESDTLVISGGTIATRGFAATDIHAGAITGTGEGTWNVSGNLDLTTASLGTGAGATTAITASGALRAVSGGATAATPAIGGRLTLTGASVLLDTAVTMPSGRFEAVATTGDLTLGAGARVNAGGSATRFHDVTRTTDGGDVRLVATAGAVIMDAAAIIDTAAHAAGGAGGRVEITASGATTLAGALRGGAFAVDSGALADFSDLNTRLNAGGFTDERSVRVRSGDIAVASGDRVATKHVTLRADTGDITVAGTIDASGTVRSPDAGLISLRAGDALTIAGAAILDASTTHSLTTAGFTTASGKVTLTADAGDLALANGAQIRLSGGGRNGGSLVITAARDGADIRVSELGATITGARESILRGAAQVNATGNFAATGLNTALSQAASWAAGAAAIRTRLGATTVEIQPEIRVVSTGNLTLTGDLNLAPARYAGAPGSLVYDVAGNLTIGGAISDGFSSATATGTLRTGRSWSIALNASGDITVGSSTTGRIVRTGTGDITVNAGRDLILANVKSVIYTAGAATTDAPGFVRSTRLGEYPVNGGDITLTAGRDIRSPVTQDFVTAWLYRYGYANTASGITQDQMTVAQQTGWSVLFSAFEQGVGALGGGDIAVRAGNDIRDLAVALPTTGQQTTAIGAPVNPGDIVVRGGGNLSMTAGNDILGGLTTMGRGAATLTAGGDITAGSKSLQRKTLTLSGNAAGNYESRDLHALFALSDATLALKARGDIRVEGIIDTMLIPTTAGNRAALNNNRVSFFNSYTERTATSLESVAGDVTYLNNPWAGADLARAATGSRVIHQLMSSPANSGELAVISRDLLFVPPTMDIVAHSGDIALTHRHPGSTGAALRLAPSAKGNLTVLASGDITTNTPIILMDVAPEYVRGAAAPFQNGSPGPAAALTLAAAEQPGVTANYGRGTTPLHTGDTEPVRLYSANGDIAGASELTAGRFNVQLPKQAFVKAAGDITNLTLNVQHNDGAAVTLVEAGRDLLRPDIRVMGEGALLVIAGRDIDLTSIAPSGIVTVGNIGNLMTTTNQSSQRLNNTFANTALGVTGADITAMAGAPTVNLDTFADTYLVPGVPGAVRDHAAALRTFMRDHGIAADASDATVYAAFRALPREVRLPFILDVYFTELKETGIDVTNPDSPRHGSYQRGFDAVERLFGKYDASAPSGDIRLFGRSFATREGGDIRIVAPTGGVFVDVITNPASGSKGILTQKGGDLRMMTRDDIALANSRVFTLQGGDILMWTTTGDITAGSGSSTLAKPPALTYLVDNDANVLLNADALQTGAGIGVLDANRTGEVDSRLDLIAPAGTVDAGDAGIRSAGAINIAARTILGTANISAGGGVTGVSAAPTVNVAAVAAANGSTAAAGGDTEAAAKAEQQRRSETTRERPPSVFTVEVLGYGGDDEPEERKPATVAAR